MPSGLKASSLTPIERLDVFIQEQKTRREEFWARHRQRGAVATALNDLLESSQAPPAATKEVKKDRTRHWNPTNCVELELHAVKAIVHRQDAIQKLAAGCAKIDEHVQLRRGFVLSNDPVFKLFFRLVEAVRDRTIDAVECVASWERNVGRGEPFVYKCAYHTTSCCFMRDSSSEVL